jgi:hypothetical protein
MQFKWTMMMLVGTLVGCGPAAKNTPAESPAPENGNQAAATAPAADAPPNVDVSDIQFMTGRDPKANIAGFKTYAWAAAEAEINDPGSKWTLPDLNIANEIIFLVNRELRGRGMTEVAENPEVLLVASAAVDTEALAALKDADSNLTIIKTIPQSSLLLGFLDPTSHETLWVGAASSELKGSTDNEVVKARLDYAIRNIIKTITP